MVKVSVVDAYYKPLCLTQTGLFSLSFHTISSQSLFFFSHMITFYKNKYWQICSAFTEKRGIMIIKWLLSKTSTVTSEKARIHMEFVPKNLFQGEFYQIRFV